MDVDPHFTLDNQDWQASFDANLEKKQKPSTEEVIIMEMSVVYCIDSVLALMVG